LNGGAVFKIGFDQLEEGAAGRCGDLQLGDARPLQGGVVVRVHIVKPQHRGPLLQQSAAEVIADEAGGAGHENGHSGWQCNNN
jgi:hypothetical protein